MATTYVDVVLRHIRKLAVTNGTGRLTDHQLLDRFAAGHDNAAFATLVERHGPMVLGVCRRVLHHLQDAEDAFQATFLILARKAGSIRRHGSVAGWLYQVAYHLAVKARASAAKRRSHPLREVDMPTADPIAELNGQELRALLDEELHHLPQQCRSALVLCYLEGKTQDEATRLLGWSKGTLRRRLGQGRELLRVRLVRRGLSPCATLIATLLAQSASKATVRAALADATVKAAAGLAAGKMVAGLVSGPIASLVEGGLKTMFLTKAKIATAVLLVLGLFAAGAGALTYRELAISTDPQAQTETETQVPKPPGAVKQAAAAEDETRKTIEVTGRVLDPDGKPVAGAAVYQAFCVQFIDRRLPPAPKMRTSTGPDGRFRFTVSKADAAANSSAMLQVVAVAKGFGPDWVQLDKPGAQELTLRLVKDDVPITGRIVDLEARPIRGATIWPITLRTTPNEDLTPWLEAIKDKKRVRHREILKKELIAPEGIPGLPPTLTTDADGRFRLTGIGRDRQVVVKIGGPKVAFAFASVLTRAVPKFQVFDNLSTDDRFMVYGASFEYVAAPARPLAGTVWDKDTGKPLAGVKIDALGPLLRATTDQEGKYRFESLPDDGAGRDPFGLPVLALPPADQPYLVGFQEVKHGPGLEAITVDFGLKRGIWVHGKVTNRVTGKPVPAYMQYHPSPDNPNRSQAADFARWPSLPDELYSTRADGTFRVPALPGPGVIIAHGPYGEYLGDGTANINPRKDAEPVQLHIILDPGRTLTGTILGPDGKPLAGARMFNVKPLHFWTPQPLETASFTLTAINPHGRRSLVFLHPEKRLVRALEVQGNEQSPLTVRLERAGTITGRLVDEDGQPRPGVDLQIHFVRKDNDYVAEHLPERTRTDQEGRFRVEGLAPGVLYQINLAGKPPNMTIGSVATRLSIKSGQTKDLGDVKGKLFQK